MYSWIRNLRCKNFFGNTGKKHDFISLYRYWSLLYERYSIWSQTHHLTSRQRTSRNNLFFFFCSNTVQPNDENQFISLFSTPLFLFLSRISKHRLLKINLWINRIFKATKYVSSLYCFFRFTTFAFENFLFHILI